MSVICKEDVRFGGFTRALCHIINGVCQVAEQMKVEIMITSGSEGTHLPNSKHYTYMAVDLRCNDFSEKGKRKLIENLQIELGPDFTVLHEGSGTPNEHIHIQLKMGLMTW